MSEQTIQTKRIKHFEKLGYYVIKLIKTNKNGIMDLIAVKPGPNVIFSEIKDVGKKRDPLQAFRTRELCKLGFRVELHDSTTIDYSTYYKDELEELKKWITINYCIPWEEKPLQTSVLIEKINELISER
jgi:hypothetical protein